MLKALPIDTQNYERRLANFAQLREKYGVTSLDVVVWPPRDFASFGGKSSEDFYHAMEDIGEYVSSGNVRSVTMRLPYQLSAHPGKTDWTKNRHGFRNCEQEIKDTFRGLACIKDCSAKADDFQLYLSYHDQCEMQLVGSMDNLIKERARLMGMTYENTDSLIDMRNRIFKEGEIITLMENTSYNKEAKPGEPFRDETAYIGAEDFKELIKRGVKMKLDPGHVVLQLLAIDEWEKGKRPLEKRLELLMAENGGKLPESLTDKMDGLQNKYILRKFIEVAGRENILSVDVSQVSGYEQHGKPLSVEGGLIDYSSIKQQLRPDVLWTPEIGGSHKDTEKEINKDLLEALEMIEKF